MSLKAVVVDDEQLAREELCYMLEQIGNIEVIAQAGNGLEAVSIVERLTPDVLFLDVQMPGLNGFEVAHRLIQNGMSPNIVFVTAFDRHAIEAFEVNAVDYLLKPVEAARLEKAVERARQRVAPPREAPLTTKSSASSSSWPSARASANAWLSRWANGSCWFRPRRLSMPL